MTPLLLTIQETRTVLRVARAKVYELIDDGTLAAFKVGADWRIRRDSVEKLVGPIPEEFFTPAKTPPIETEPPLPAPTPAKVAVFSRVPRIRAA